jgi:hypothetical protein
MPIAFRKRKRKRGREKVREKEREKERIEERKREREREREKERERKREREREREKERERWRERERGRERGRAEIHNAGQYLQLAAAAIRVARFPSKNAIAFGRLLKFSSSLISLLIVFAEMSRQTIVKDDM